MSQKDFFSTIQRSFVDVEVDSSQEINTQQFLEASTSVVKIFDVLGSTGFAIVKTDMNGNIEKLTKAHAKNPDACATLQKMVASEANTKPKVATDALMWLRRGFELTSLALRRSLDNPNEELNKSFSTAYDQTLSKHHNFMVRPLFAVAMKVCPYRADFYAKIGAGKDEELNKWLAALEKQVAILKDFYISGKHET